MWHAWLIVNKIKTLLKLVHNSYPRPSTVASLCLISRCPPHDHWFKLNTDVVAFTIQELLVLVD